MELPMSLRMLELSELLDSKHLSWPNCTYALTLFVLLFILRAYLRLFFRPKRLIDRLQKQGIKGQPFKPIVGQMREITNQGQDVKESDKNMPYLFRWRAQHGSTFFYCFGPKVRLAVTDPALAHAVLNATTGNGGHYKKIDYSAAVFEPVLGKNGLVFASNANWPRQRKLVNPSFSHGKLKEMEHFVIESTQELIARWEKSIDSAGGRAEIEVNQELSILTRDVICRSVFGDQTRGDAAFSGGDIYRDFSTLLKDINMRGFSLGGLLIPGYKYLPLPINLRIDRNRQKIRTMILSLISNRRKEAAAEAKASGKSPQYGDDLLGSLLAASDEKGSLSSEELIDQCKTFFFAGHETSGHALTWTMLLLSQHPEWQERARAEVREVCGDGLPEKDAVGKLKLITMVLRESMRLFPPVIYVGREVCKPHQLGPYLIPADSSLQIELPIYLLHRDKSNWGEDADTFNPERFANGIAGAAKDSRAYVPFTAGPRNCVGQQFAMMETKIVLAMILQKFSFSVAPGYKHHPHSTITLRPKYGLPLLVEKVVA